MDNISIGHRLWLNKDEKFFLGLGRVALLKAIEDHGSISAAARSMNMSYKKAWQAIDAMNSLSDEPLVIRTTGGSGGGGTKVTEAGHQAVELYDRINSSCNQFLDNHLKSNRP